MEIKEPAQIYLSHINQIYALKNAFHRAVASEIKKFDRQIVPDVVAFKTQVTNYIEVIHNSYERSKLAFVEYGYHGFHEHDVSLRIGSAGHVIVSMNLYFIEPGQLEVKAKPTDTQTFDKPAQITSNAIWDDEHLDVDAYAP